MEPRVSLVTLGVADLARAYSFYKDGLGLPTTRTPEDGIVFFQTSGVTIALYPYSKLAEDVGPGWDVPRSKFAGITLAHNVRERHQVDEVMKMAATAGAQIVKPAADAFWGGYDHGAIAEPELSAVILADAHPLDEPEGRTQPGDRLAHVGIDQNRDDR